MRTKTALITGASRGLGRTMALTLAAKGYRIIVNYRSSSGDAREVAALAGEGSCAIRADVGDPADVRALASEIQARYGRIDAVVNNAGISSDALLLRQTEEEWDSVIRTNLTGCFNIIKQLSPLMAGLAGGHIVNISSHSGLRGKKGQAAYSASKAGLLGLTVSAARELGGAGIRVNAIMPGYLETDMGSRAAAAKEEALRQSATGSLASGQEAAGLLAWLLTTAGITGQVFSLDSRLI